MSREPLPASRLRSFRNAGRCVFLRLGSMSRRVCTIVPQRLLGQGRDREIGAWDREIDHQWVRLPIHGASQRWSIWSPTARAAGANLAVGGERGESKGGLFYRPTVLAHVPVAARAMNEEPFGPMALINSFRTVEKRWSRQTAFPMV